MRMNTLSVTVPKSELLDCLKRNRKEHAEDTALAREGFRMELQQELEEKLETLKAGGSVNLQIQCRKPDTHLDDYDDVIGMLEMATDTTVELSHEQYKCWVRDQWDWRDQWVASNTAYITAASLPAVQ